MSVALLNEGILNFDHYCEATSTVYGLI